MPALRSQQRVFLALMQHFSLVNSQHSASTVPESMKYKLQRKLQSKSRVTGWTESQWVANSPTRSYKTRHLSNFSLSQVSDPQPDMAWNLFQAAMCVQIVGVHVSCSSHVCTQLAAFFIDPRAEWSTTRGFYFVFLFLFIACFSKFSCKYLLVTKFSLQRCSLAPQRAKEARWELFFAPVYNHVSKV